MTTLARDRVTLGTAYVAGTPRLWSPRFRLQGDALILKSNGTLIHTRTGRFPPRPGRPPAQGFGGLRAMRATCRPAVPYCTPGARGNLRPPRSRSRGGMDDAAHRRLDGRRQRRLV